MRRSICLGVLTFAGVFATIAVNEARQDRAALATRTIADNLFMLANAPSVQGMGGGGNTAIFVMTSARRPRYCAFTASRRR